MREYDTIEMIIKDFPRCPTQLNNFMSCDAEIIDIGGQLMAFTIDSFSPQEDLFTNDDPETLGYNLVVATLSDLYAAGANPFLFLQTLALEKNIDKIFLAGISQGIKKALLEADCFLAGGDFGTCDKLWDFTGCAIGKITANKYLQRILPDEPQTLWVTGNLGDANLAILSKEPTPKFELRKNEAKIIQQYATTCIDTSSGMIDAIFCLSRLKPKHTIILDLEKIPITHKAYCCKTLGVPKEALLVGGAGEYELIFTTPTSLPRDTQKQLIDTEITPIGEAHLDHFQYGVHVKSKHLRKQITRLPPCPRTTKTLDDYCKQALQFTNDFLVSN